MCALSLLNLFLLLLLCLGDSSDPPVNLLYAGCLESGIGNLTLVPVTEIGPYLRIQCK